MPNSNTCSNSNSNTCFACSGNGKAQGASEKLKNCAFLVWCGCVGFLWVCVYFGFGFCCCFVVLSIQDVAFSDLPFRFLESVERL